MNPTGVNLHELLRVLQRKGIPLQFEMGTFLVLEATEKVLALQASERKLAAPGRVTAELIWLSDEGELALADVMAAPSETAACQALVELLGTLLVRSAPGVPAMLLELVEQGPSDGEWTLRRLRDDLEASLLPLNRGATRRVLSRLLREMKRDVDRGGSSKPPDPKSVDRALDDLLGMPLTDGSAPAQRDGASLPEVEPVPAVVRFESDDDEESSDEAPAERPMRIPGPARMPREAVSRAAEPGPKAKAPALRRKAAKDDDEVSEPPRSKRAVREPSTLSGEPSPRLGLDDFDREVGAKGSGLKAALLLAVATAVIVGGYLLLGRDHAREAIGMSGQAEAKAPPPPPKPQKRYGELRVTSEPDKAQVLLLIGTAPVLVPNLPVGVAHEFVAVADGMAPGRAIVPASAAWTHDEGEARYELAVQLGEGKSASGAGLGPSRMPQVVGTPSGTLGTVRVVTTPPGARVYQLIGFTPDVSLQNVDVDQPIDLLVYAAGYAPQHATAGPGSYHPEGSGLVATLDVKLTRAR